ncbi:hypothetical protein KY285_031913 [Solanum tuberosum]|nr:hypothetical protein KY285_031913 [Solanum tuberosum]
MILTAGFDLIWNLLNHEIKTMKFEEPIHEESAKQIEVQGSYEFIKMRLYNLDLSIFWFQK